MDIETIVTPGLGNATHLIANTDGDAVLVDPPRDAWRVLAVAARHGWRVTHALETHVHNDYLSGALELRASDGVEILAPARGDYAFAHRPMDQGDVLDLGDLRFTARATPGHTPEHLAWEVTVSDRPDAMLAVATGGSLLVGSVGRTDLLGPAAMDDLTAAQYRTIRELAVLPEGVLVLPTHGSGSFCAAGPVDGARTTTIGQERRTNPLLAAMDETAFRTAVLAGFGPYPTYYREMAPINRAGPAVLGAAPTPARLDPAAVRAAISIGAHVVDARTRTAFAAGHLPGSLGIELDEEAFASYVGWLVPFGAPIVLVLPEPIDAASAQAVAALLRIGYDRVVGVLDGGMDAWLTAGGDVVAYPLLAHGDLAGEIKTGVAGTVLDVRDPNEWHDDGRIEGARTISLGSLVERIDELPRDGPITVLCKSGTRASIAASVLHAAGFDVRLVAGGGAPDVLAELPAARAAS
ncbi:MAG: rhodanese-like domain-containing protein [Candidatus Limnocylindrales bacterium]